MKALKIKSRISVLLLLLLAVTKLNAQELLDTLTWDSFTDIVKTYHPVTVQAKLLSDLAKAKRTQALGGFDPKLEGELDQKQYSGTEYYRFLTPQVKLPLWYGIELKGSYSEAEGSFVNPENRLPQEGLSYAGVSFQLGKGLLMDKRRAAYKQAQIFTKATENEKIRIINDLFQSAGEEYINWQNKFQIVKVYQEALNLAKVRFEGVKKTYQFGDRAAIDTVEALLQIQTREIMLQQANLELQSAKYMLSTFMWLQNNQSVDADKLLIQPQDELIVPFTPLLDITNNPKLLSFGFKINDLNIERRLKAENLRPELGLQFGILNQGLTPFRNINQSYWNDNNKVNFRVAFPLTFSKERGELAEAKIKIKQVEIEQNLVQNELLNKMKQNAFELSTLQNQINTLKQNYISSDQLLKGEELRFKVGESSLFLINARESKLIEVKEKLLETEAKLRKVQLKTLWLQGTLYQNF
jgi:outer membrane protein TolC